MLLGVIPKDGQSLYSHCSIVCTKRGRTDITWNHSKRKIKKKCLDLNSGTEFIMLVMLEHMHLQYRSKVSYHPLSCFSRDESLVSRDEMLVSLVSGDETLVLREPLKRIFWNKLQAVSWQGNDKFSRRGEVCSARASGFLGFCFTRRFKRNELRLTNKKPKRKRWKINTKFVGENSRSAVA